MYVNIIVDIHIAPCENGIEHLSSFKTKKPFDDHDAGVDHWIINQTQVWDQILCSDVSQEFSIPVGFTF